MPRTFLAIAMAFLVVGLGSGCGSKGDSSPSASGSGDPSSSTSSAAAARQKSASDPMHPIVEIETSLGTIVVKLDMENSPGTATNFLNYVNSSHYNGTLFHYIEAGTMILGGGFTPDLQMKDVSAPIRNEAHNGLKNLRGTIAMSRYQDVIDSATCQFFINLTDNSSLDHQDLSPEGYGYCVFGKVINGLEIVEKISKSEVHDAGDFLSTPRKPIVIKAAKPRPVRR